MHPPRSWRALLVALVLFAACAARARPPVRYEGVERTEPAFLDNALRLCEEEAPLLDGEAVRGCLYDTKLFADVDVQPGDPGYVAVIDERWTLIPLPVVRFESGNTQGGLFLIENNLLGAGKLLVVGGVYGSLGWQARAILRDSAIFYSNWTATLTWLHQDMALRHLDGGRVVDGFDETADRARLAIGHRFGSSTEVSGLIDGQWLRYGAAHGFEHPADLNALSLGLALRWKRTRFRVFFDEGLSLRLEGLAQVARDDEAAVETDPLRRVSGQGSWQVNTFGEQALQVRVSGLWSAGADGRTAERLGASAGLRGAKADSIWARHYGALAIDYQVPVWHPSFGTVTVAPFADVAALDLALPDESRALHLSGGVGTYLFLRDVAFPGVGLVMGYERRMGFFVTAAVGAGG